MECVFGPVPSRRLGATGGGWQVADREPRLRSVAPGGGPFLDSDFVRGYEAWYSGPGRRADRLETNLLSRLLDWIGPPGTLLEIGVGTGHFARRFAPLGWRVVGVDISAPMLRDAAWLDSPPVACGDALRLPFRDVGFDVAALVATLEFVADSDQALREAVRVSRRGLLIGALNRSSRLGRRVRSAIDEPWRSARLLTVRELRRATAEACTEFRRSTIWRTTLWPIAGGAWPLPWGDFIGMAVRWKTRSRREHHT